MLPFETHYLEKPPVGGVLTEQGLRIYTLGDEGNWLVCFQPCSDAQFVSACIGYELDVEKYNSTLAIGGRYRPQAVTRRRVELLYDKYPDEWRISWDYDKYPGADILVSMLTRW